MYSIVLMAALTGGADLPDCHRNSCGGGCSGGGHHGHRGHGCSGCYGGYSGCYGGFYGGYYGCYGGYSGCYGGGYGGYVGCSGYGGCSGFNYSYGGCSGWGCAGAGSVGTWVSPYGVTTYGGAPVVTPGTPGTTTPGVTPGTPPGTTLPPPATGGKKGDKETSRSAPATILVTLPADARLTVDGNRTTSTSASRVLVTPELRTGLEYYYTLRAEVVRDGQTVSQTQQIAVRAGSETPVSFNFSSASVASSR